MTKRYCASFPCSNLAVNGAYCLDHRPATVTKVTDPFYLSVAWRRFRAWYLGKHPLCEQCEREGRLTTADMVDHIVELKDGGARLAEENAMSLCWKCHAVKTANVKNHRESKRNNRVGSTKETYFDAEVRMGEILEGIPRSYPLGSPGQTKTLPPDITKKQSHQAQERD